MKNLVPGAKWEPDEKWFNNRDQNEGDQKEDRTNAKIEAQGRAQSSEDIWISSNEIHKGTHTVEIKIEDTEDEQPSVSATKKQR